MKHLFLIFITIIISSCGTPRTGAKNEKTTIAEQTSSQVKKAPLSEADYAKNISPEELKQLLYNLASDDFEGRKTGEAGQKKAAAFISGFYKKLGIEAANADGDYLQHIPLDYFRGRSKDSSENVVAWIKGSSKPDEYVIFSAHYDHLGMDGKETYNGADDDGSGTVAVMEIARAFKKAADNGKGPERSVVFLHVTGEEIGLFGSRYYSEHPLFPLENTIADLNIDMVGRVDEKYKDNPDFVYLIGSDKLSTELHEISEATNKKYTQLTLDYTYNNENDPNRFYYRSDHYNFAKNGIPIIFYFNGTHEDYHQTTDTPDKINYNVLAKRAQLVFLTGWELANRDKRIAVDKK